MEKQITEFTLRPWKETDVESLVQHANNRNIACWLTNAFPHPYTREDGKNYIKAISGHSPTQVLPSK